MTRMLTIIAVLPVLLASACSPVRIVESDEVTFVKLDRPIKFADEVYTTEDSFRLIDLSNGQQGVVFGFQSVPQIIGPSSVNMGVTVDDNLCFGQKLLVFDLFWQVRDFLPPMTQNFCFKVERKVDLR